MTLLELNEIVASLVADQANIGLVLYPVILSEAGNDELRIADLAPEVGDELKGMILGFLQEKFLLNEELHYGQLSDADSRKNTAFYYDLAQRPPGLAVLQDVLQNDQRPEFSFSNDDIHSIKGFVITLGTQEGTIALYKRYHHLSTMQADRVLGIFKSDHRFVKMTEDVLKLSKTIDFLQVNDHLIIANLKALESGFGYENVIRAQASQNIDAIAQINLLEDIAPLREMAQDIKFAKRIMRIKTDSPVMRIPIAAVIKFVQTHKPIMKKFRISEDGLRLKLDTKVSQKLFLALMNDDLLTSELTNLYYAGLAKDIMEIAAEPEANV